MIRIELSGNSLATACGKTVKASGYSGPVGKLCRALIADGYAAHDVVEVFRGCVLSFKPCRLSQWADTDVTEGVGYSCRIVKHKPFNADIWEGR